MNTKTKLEEALKDAMRNKDEVSKRTLRMVVSAIRLAEVDRGNKLDESAVLAIVQKEVKSRQETIVAATQGDSYATRRHPNRNVGPRLNST